MLKKIKVLIIDDSAVVRKLLTEILKSDQQIDKVESVADPYQAVEKIKSFKPDLLTLDVEMPKMNGIQFLRRLMANYPLPVVMISSLTKQGSQATIKALEYGAVDFIAKPDLSRNEERKHFKATVLAKVKQASEAKVEQLGTIKSKDKRRAKHESDSTKLTTRQQRKVIAIGSSTGGVKALKEVIPYLPANFPGVVIIQHMPQGFTTSFAHTLNQISELTVKEAENGEQIRPGVALLAPGDFHLTVKKQGSKLIAQLDQEAKINHQRPAVDKTFSYLAQVGRQRVIGLLLTGMGQDGAGGLKEIKEAGGYTIAESEKTATIFGMPKKAIDLGAVSEVLALPQIAQRLIKLVGSE
ncbi:MAG: protein-glutamate methylesterase/protein-glutamine glutaminase [Bacillota bacterium]